MEITRYPTKYKTQQERFLYIAFSKFGSFVRLARTLGVTKQYIHEIVNEGSPLPSEYVSYLAYTLKLHPGLFHYSLWVQLTDDRLSYDDLLSLSYNKSLTQEEMDYIRAGTRMPDRQTLLKEIWKKALKPRKAKKKKS